MTTTRHTSRAGRATRLLAGGLSLGLAVVALSAVPAEAAFDPSVANPDLTASCGLDVVIALDASDSIPNAQEVRDAANTLIGAFTDTSTRLGVVTFSAAATAKLPLTLVTTDSVKPTGAHGVAVASYKRADGTNWQDALLKSNQLFAAAPVRSGVKKLLIMVSDGQPRNYNLPDGTPSAKLAISDPLVVNPAVAQANAFKTAGGHMLALGVGVTAADTVAYDTLKAVSDPAGQFSPETAFDATKTDVVLTPNYTALKTDLKAVVTQLCAGSLTVTERATSKTAPNTYGNGGSGWAVSTTVSPAGGYIKPTTSSAATVGTTTDAGGTALFQWNSGPSWTKTLSFTMGSKPNYKYAGVTCTRNGTKIAATVAGNKVTVSGGITSSSAVACTVNNYWTGPLASIVKLTPSKKTVVYTKSTITLRGSLASPLAPLASQTVYVQSKAPTATAWKTIKKFTTSSKGTFSMKVTPKRTTQYRATYGGKSKARAQYAGASAPATVSVGTAVFLKLSSSSVRKGATVTFSGKVSPKKKGATVYLQRLVGKNWTTVTSKKLSSKSTYTIKYKTTSTTDYRWRIYKPADKKNTAGYSGGLVLRVS